MRCIISIQCRRNPKASAVNDASAAAGAENGAADVGLGAGASAAMEEATMIAITAKKVSFKLASIASSKQRKFSSFKLDSR